MPSSHHALQQIPTERNIKGGPRQGQPSCLFPQKSAERVTVYDDVTQSKNIIPNGRGDYMKPYDIKRDWSITLDANPARQWLLLVARSPSESLLAGEYQHEAIVERVFERLLQRDRLGQHLRIEACTLD